MTCRSQDRFKRKMAIQGYLRSSLSSVCISFSQGSVATRLKCGATFNVRIIAHFQEILTVKKFENRHVFDEVMRRIP